MEYTWCACGERVSVMLVFSNLTILDVCQTTYLGLNAKSGSVTLPLSLGTVNGPCKPFLLSKTFSMLDGFVMEGVSWMLFKKIMSTQ